MFYFRHQAAGIVYAFPFAKPTEEDIAMVRELCLRKHGERHPRTGEPYWDCMVETTGELDANGSPVIIVHGHTEAMSGHPAPISPEQRAEADASERLVVEGRGRGRVTAPKE